ncbi:hypothetical protein GCM10025777_24040 [Membranihabitans marinus]
MWVLTPWAMVFSKAALSIIVALLAVGIIIKVSSPSETVEGSKYHPYFMLLALVVVSGFWTHNTGHWIHLINVSMPLLVYPISYGQNKLLLSRNRNLVFHQFLWASLTLALYIVGLFIFKNEEIIELIKSGGSLALPNNHIRTSLIIAVTAIWSIHQWMTGKDSTIRPWIYGLAAVVVFLELHFIAVRSGIVIGYFGLVIYLWRQWEHWRSNRLTVMLSLILAVGISMIYFPFLQAKWQYWIEDIQNMDGFAWNYYSDAVRFKTMAMGIEIGQEHPIFGIGLGDVLDEMTLKFQIQDNIVLSKVIHNMFITWWAGSGFIGLGIALYALYIIGQRQRKKAMEWTVFWMIMVSCLVENTLQVYVGETLFVLFTVFSTDY